MALDTDLDGIRDTIDLCPYQKETFNNIQDTDGCPDERSTELFIDNLMNCLLYTSPSPRDATLSRMPSSA